MKEKVVQKAESLVGKYCRYGNQYLTIHSFKIDDEYEKFYLYTSLRKLPFDRPMDAALVFMSEFVVIESEGVPIPVEQKPDPTEYAHLVERTLVKSDSDTKSIALETYEAPPMKMLGSENLAKELKDIMMENIKRLKEDKEFLQQAEAINANVNTVIDLAKTEIAYMMAIHKTGR